MDERNEGERNEEAGRSEALGDWLTEQIEETAYLERLDLIAAAIADDKAIGAEYLTEDCLRKLRLAWSSKKRQLDMAGNCQASKAKAQTEVTGEGSSR